MLNRDRRTADWKMVQNLRSPFYDIWSMGPNYFHVIPGNAYYSMVKREERSAENTIVSAKVK